MRSKSGLLYGVYTISPLHVGTGQAVGAVDLPVAREKHTGLPFIPATSIKGVVRDKLEIHLPEGDKSVSNLLGPDMKDADGLSAGSLIFTEAQSLLIPFRSLNKPFVYVTSHLVLERFERNLRTFGFTDALSDAGLLEKLDPAMVYVSDKNLHGNTLVIEDVIFNEKEVFYNESAWKIAETLGQLLPDDEKSTRKRLINGLVIMPDQEYLSLVNRGLPVQARIKLTKGKTTSEFPLPDNSVDKGNLWYEESVPADSLFAFFIMNRPGANSSKTPVDDFIDTLTAKNTKIDLSVIQIGGNETVGYGWCQWHRIQNSKTASANTAGDRV